MDDSTEIHKRVAEIVSTFMELPPGRAVVYDQNYEAPKDTGVYITVALRQVYTLGSKKEYDSDTDEEINRVSMFADIDIDITSQNDEALERKEEVIMALTSYNSVNLQNKYSFKLFRNSGIMDLSFISGASATHRFRIPVRASYVKIKRSGVEYYDKFRDTQIEIEE